MALPVVTPVGEKTANALREKLIPAMEALRVGVSTDPEAHYGPVVTAAHKAKVEGWIQKGVDEGARSEEHTSELQSLMRSSYAVFCLKKKNESKTLTSYPFQEDARQTQLN